MQITITAEPLAAALADVDNLRGLSVQAGSASDAQVGEALAASGLGSFDGEHAWLSIDAIREAGSAQSTDPAWAEQWAGTVAYAADHGWVDESGANVRAHVERD